MNGHVLAGITITTDYCIRVRNRPLRRAFPTAFLAIISETVDESIINYASSCG